LLPTRLAVAGEAKPRSKVAAGFAHAALLHRRATPAEALLSPCLAPQGESSVELLGALSNQELQERLQRLSGKLDRLVASQAPRRQSVRADTILRPGLLPRLIMQAFQEAPGPLLVREVQDEVEALLGRPVARSSVKNWLAKHAGRGHELFVRLGRGRYGLNSDMSSA
jgi:hypothetical protein